MAFSDWSTNPTSNAVTPGMDWAEGMSPALINNNVREMMAQLKAAIAPLASPALTGSPTVTNGSPAGAGNVTYSFNALYNDGNANYLTTVARRMATGTTWTTLALELQRRTDGDNQQIMRFNPTSSGTAFEWLANSATSLATLSTTGDFVAVGNVGAYSDAKLKRGIATMESQLEKVKRLRPVTYTLKDTDINSMGFIAQEVEKLFPTMIGANGDKTLYIRYFQMFAPVVAALQEVIARVEQLEAHHDAT